MRELIGLLERLLHAAEAGERTGSVIEILVLQALTLQIQGDIPAACVPLSRALALAEPEGYVRLFIDEGSPMKLLIVDCRLQTARSVHGESNRHTGTCSPIATSRWVPFRAAEHTLEMSERRKTNLKSLNLQSAMVEPLSQRELDVLRLLRTDLSGPEIARELMVSLSTVRTHTRNIYTKLGVTNRRAAIHRAETLALF